MTHTEKPVDWEKVEEMTLALLYLTTFEEGLSGPRAWKGHAFEVMDRLHSRGWIANPKGQAKSVALTEEGARRSRELFEQHFLGPLIL